MINKIVHPASDLISSYPSSGNKPIPFMSRAQLLKFGDVLVRGHACGVDSSRHWQNERKCGVIRVWTPVIWRPRSYFRGYVIPWDLSSGYGTTGRVSYVASIPRETVKSEREESHPQAVGWGHLVLCVTQKLLCVCVQDLPETCPLTSHREVTSSDCFKYW